MNLVNIMLSEKSPTQEYNFIYLKLKWKKLSMMIHGKTVVIFREEEVTERDPGVGVEVALESHFMFCFLIFMEVTKISILKPHRFDYEFCIFLNVL